MVATTPVRIASFFPAFIGLSNRVQNTEENKFLSGLSNWEEYVYWCGLVSVRSKGNPNLVPRCPLYPRPAVGNGKVPIPDRCSRVTRASGNEIEVLLSTKDWIELSSYNPTFWSHRRYIGRTKFVIDHRNINHKLKDIGMLNTYIGPSSSEILKLAQSTRGDFAPH